MRVRLLGGDWADRVCLLPCTSPLDAHLAPTFGHSLSGKELWGTLPSGRLGRIDITKSPADYGYTEGTEWTLCVRSPPIAASATAGSDEYLMMNMETGETSPLRSRSPSDGVKAVPEAKPAPAPAARTKRVCRNRVAAGSGGDFAAHAKSLTQYCYAVNDTHFSRDFAKTVLAEAAHLQERGLAARAGNVPKGTGVPKASTHAGTSCWITGEHHPSVRRWLRMIDGLARMIPGLNLGERSPALLSCYEAGEGRPEGLQYDTAHDPRRKLTVTMFMQPAAGSGGDFHMVTQRHDVTIAPLLGRVLMYWSDARCRYEMRPPTSQPLHFTTTVWYYQRTPDYIASPLPITPRQLSATSPVRSVKKVLPQGKAPRTADAEARAAEERHVKARATVPEAPAGQGKNAKKNKKRRANKKKNKKKAADGAAVRQASPLLFDAGSHSASSSDESDSDSEDNWVVFCCTLRAALAASLASAVTTSVDTTPIPTADAPAAAVAAPPAIPLLPLAQAAASPPAADPSRVLAPLLGELAGLGATAMAHRRDARLLRRMEAEMQAHRAAVDDLLEDALDEMVSIVQQAVAFAADCGAVNAA
eukprot:TRINITY_DN18069_c0_g2_i1.p1 TRINITY_DN18069_c0_g2~~TRINITY_DN18069_c0_g2_i1.p1  ORF type:complete len:588 (+),score=146.10 TRINITY_DN18069_c0_g2_i1:69-1832(+)